MATEWARVSRAEGWRLERREYQVEVWHDNELFTVYKFYPDQYRPWFYPVNSPSGRSVTEELNDYPIQVSNYPLNGPELQAGVLPHLRALAIGHAEVNGYDCWHEWPGEPEKGRVHHQGVVREESGPNQAALSTRSLWRSLGGEDLMEDQRTFRFFGSEGKRIIDVELVFSPAGNKKVALAQNHHSLLYARLVRSMSVQKGGRIWTAVSSGDQGETMGKESPWCDYSGPIVGPDGPWHGIALMESPNNPWTSHAWTRDYGFIAMGSFNWHEYTIPVGGSLRLGYRVVVHDGDADEADIAGEWKRYGKEVSAG